MISTVLEDSDFDESNFDSDLEAFQFIHEESIKDENIANIIQDLMCMDQDDTELSPSQELHFKPININNIQNIPDPDQHILISSKPNKIKLAPCVQTSKTAKPNPSPSKHQSSKPGLVSSTLVSPKNGIKIKINKCKELKNGSGLFKPGKLVLTEKVNQIPNSIKTETEFREPAIPAHSIGLPGKQTAKGPTSSNVYLERNKENAQQQNVKIVKRSNDLQIAPKAAGKAVKVAKKRPPPTSTAQLQHQSTLIIQQNQQQLLQNPQNTNTEVKPVLENSLLDGQYDNGSEPSNEFIGDWKRMFVTFDHLEENSVNSLDYRAERFMNNLDSWGVTSEVPRPVFDGFSMDTDPLEGIEQEIPEDWKDDYVFSELDRMAVSENVFLHKWLPKCALRMRVNPYRKMLRALNEKDPYFNIMLA